jgi:rRNA maturation protein Nop10
MADTIYFTGTDGPIEFKREGDTYVVAHPERYAPASPITLHVCTHCGARWMNDEEPTCSLWRQYRA